MHSDQNGFLVEHQLLNAGKTKCDAAVEFVAYTFLVTYVRKELQTCTNLKVMQTTIEYMRQKIDKTGVQLTQQVDALLADLESGDKTCKDLKPLWPVGGPYKNNVNLDTQDGPTDTGRFQQAWQAIRGEAAGTQAMRTEAMEEATVEVDSASVKRKLSLSEKLKSRKNLKVDS